MFKRYLMGVCIASILPLVSNAEPISKKVYGSVIVDEVTSVYDGDTFRAQIDSWPDVIGYRVPVRLRGADTPEIRGKCAREKELARAAKQFTVAFLRRSDVVELRGIQRGRNFRLIADVYGDGQSLANALVAHGHARACDKCYRKNATWCDVAD